MTQLLSVCAEGILTGVSDLPRPL